MIFLQNSFGATNNTSAKLKRWAMLLLLMSSVHMLVFTGEVGVLKKVLPSIVIIDSERIAYNSPYKQDVLNSLLYPFDFETFNTSPNGNGITHKNIFGSGSIIKKSTEKDGNNETTTYYILSNNHVVEKSSSIWITTYDGYIHKGTVLGADIERDIALVSFVSETDYPLVTIGDYTTLEIGMPTYAIGTPYGFIYTVTEGIISSLDKTDSSLKNIFIQTDASMNPGNSGGALINKNGELIGVSTWIYSPKGSSSIGINFASSINTAMKVVDNILAGKKDDHAWIGIIYSAYAPSILNKMDIDYRFGAIVTNIIKDSPAEHAGIVIGDMITKVDTQTVKSFNPSLTNTSALISTLDSNVAIDITIKRAGKTKILPITPIESPLLQTQDAVIQISKNIWPGMNVLPLEDYKQELLGLEVNKSFVLYVKKIIPHTPAHSAGINANDVIVKINNKAIKTYQDYLDIINDYKSNDTTIVFGIFENGTLIEKILPRK